MNKFAMMLASAIALAACEPTTTKEGCPIGVTEIGMAQTRACQQAYYEEMARAKGGTVTRCIDAGGSTSCTTY